MKRLFLLAGCVLTAAAALAEPVTDAIDRPAVISHLAQRSLLLSAAKVGTRLVAVGERGIIVLSDDAGKTWRQARVPVSVTLTAVSFADARHGFAVGHSGVVLSSDDAGESWKKRFDGVEAARIVLRDAKASGDAASLLEANRLVRDGGDKPFLDLHFFDAQHALIVGAYNLAFYTADGGQSWQSWMDRLDNPKSLHLYALRVHGDTILLAGEQGLVLRSDNAGKSFRRIATPYKGSFFTAELPTGQDMILGGLRGNVWRSGDAGETWSKIPLSSAASVTASALRDDGEIVLVNQAGMVFSGASMTPMSLPALSPLNDVLPLKNGLLVLSGQGITMLPDTHGDKK